MRIIIDAMGGDNAPEEIVKGAVSARKKFGVDITLVGRKNAIVQCLEREGISASCNEYQIVMQRKSLQWRTSPVRQSAANGILLWRWH